MTALVRKRSQSEPVWNYKEFVLLSGQKAFQGGACCLVVGTNKVVAGAPGANRKYIGNFAEDVDATGGDKLVNVDLIDEITMRRWANDPGAGAITALDAGKLCYFIDDQTVSLFGTLVAGVIWDFTAAKGVAVQKIATTGVGAPGSVDAFALAAFAANDAAPATVQSGSVYDVPTTTAASTVTLPTAAADGTSLQFVADGVKNAHTVQYRDALGTVALTTALVASKRHLVIATKSGGKWFANAYVSP